MGDTSWAFLLIGSAAAVGAALAIGTLAALVRYYRTGTFPGVDEPDGPGEVSTGRLAALWIRIVIGVILTIAGIVVMVRAELI